MKYKSLPSFDKDMKKLSKRYSSLNSDFKFLVKYHIEAFHIHGVRSDDPVEISGCCGKDYKSYKVRKFACKSLRGSGKNSGLRLIYVYELNPKIITFVEIYYKGDKENEDKGRLKEFTEGLDGEN